MRTYRRVGPVGTLIVGSIMAVVSAYLSAIRLLAWLRRTARA